MGFKQGTRAAEAQIGGFKPSLSLGCGVEAGHKGCRSTDEEDIGCGVQAGHQGSYYDVL